MSARPDSAGLATDAAAQRDVLGPSLQGFAWWMAFVVLVLMSADWLRGNPSIPPRAMASLAVALGTIVCIRFGAVRLGFGVLLGGLALLIGSSVYGSGGLEAPQVAAAAILLILTGWMMGPLWAVAATGLLGLGFIALLLLQTSGHLPPSRLGEDPYRRLLVHLHTFALLGGLCWYVFGRIRDQLGQLRQANAELAAGTARLQEAEHSLKASERRFQDIAQAAGDWFWETDAQGRFTWLSDSVEQVTGLPAARHWGRSRADFISPEQARSDAWLAHQAILARREPFRDFRYLGRGLRGNLWVSVSGTPVFGPDGEFLGYRGSSSDITEQVNDAAEVHRTNELLRAAIEEIDEGFLLCDQQDRVVLANRSFRSGNPLALALLDRKCTYEEYLRYSLTQGQIAESADRIEAFVAERLRHRQESSRPFERRHRDGRYLLMRDKRLPDGCTITISLDITDRQRVEEELRGSRRLLENVIDALPMAIFAKDAHSNYVMVNKQFAQLQCATKEQLLRKNTSDVGRHEGSRQKSLADDEWVYRHRRTLDQPEVLLETPDGRKISFHSTKIPLFNENEELIGLLGINRDITEDLRAQAKLRASEERFSALFHNARVPQLVSNAETGIIEDANHAFCELLGIPAQALIGGKSLEELSTSSAVGAPDAGTTGVREVVLLRADGEPRTLLGSSFSIDTETGRRVAWSLQDITDQRAAQEQMRRMNQTLEHAVQQRTEQLTAANAELQVALDDLEASQEALLHSEKLAALGRIVAGVAHELNTPIGNSLLSATTLADQTRLLASQVAQGLRKSFLDSYVATVRDAGAILLRNLERAAELVGSFKQLAVDQTSSQRRTFDLRMVIEEVLLSHRPMLRNARVEVQIDCSPGIVLDSFPGPLGQVVGNLIANAVVHGYEGHDGGGVVEISAHTPAGDQVMVQVRDHGRGIDPASSRRIFEPFFTTRLGRGGSGLGLHIVHNIVTGVLGGSIEVQSQPGQGSCFTVRFPRTAAA